MVKNNSGHSAWNFEIQRGERVGLKLDGLLNELLKEPKRCSGCGGITPELGVIYKGYTFLFTCYAIWENKDGKPSRKILETDYSRLAHYTKKE